MVAGVALAVAGCGRDEPRPPPSPSAPSGPDFVVLSDVDQRILTDIRYATAYNFIGRPVDGYQEPLCLLTTRAAEALRGVQDAALAVGRSLKVYDCYRPQRATDDFLHWAGQPGQDAMRVAFHPRVAKAELVDRGYLGAPSAHSRGSTVDVTLVDVPAPEQPRYVPGQPLAACTAPQAQRFADNSVDMGTGFDCFDPSSHIDSDQIDPTARENRRQLRQLMTAGGFVGYDQEWWHFRYGDEPWPDTYFDLPVTRSSAR
ncbi:M15 family metallopeptidase [Micromonospora endophytica]|uniref:D-alanyl-D-alanine dipeptidase n=1 Tax=Micromonospora endophytica TaxID=515350 RepID=A0A2W2B7N0_9ACTN|nr:M15 family metallopeptidase [Micromonospora endophytica]PZF83481.1 D-alanyl-D-alanine dipeptidase [Micromonospora endophytica]RIW44324.1 D-alanyl-D-alanine dipeptidase [Micromonospora endophytica]BCJ62486.1 D-alanyl-D-alanine dipeptidase [Micromonospora endophytica]